MQAQSTMCQHGPGVSCTGCNRFIYQPPQTAIPQTVYHQWQPSFGEQIGTISPMTRLADAIDRLAAALEKQNDGGSAF